MSKLSLLTVASLRSQLRWARQHVFYWAVLTPVVLVGTLAIVSRVASNLGSWRLPALTALTVAFVGELFIVAIALSRSCSELYHIRRPESMFEAAPLDPAIHLHLALITRFARTVVTGALLLVVANAIGDIDVGLAALCRVGAFAAVTAMAQLWTALSWIHWQHKREWKAATASVLILLTSLGAFGGPLVLSLIAPHYLPRWADPELMVSGFGWAGVMYLVLREAHSRWRAGDVEHARRIYPARGRSRIFPWVLARAARKGKMTDRCTSAQIARDIALTVRVFSTGVYGATGFALLVGATLFVILATGWLPPSRLEGGPLDATWLPPVMASKAACVLATASLSSLTPILIAHEGPRLWLERAVGTSGHQVWLAKLWYTRVVSAGTPVVTWLIGVSAGQVPGFYVAPLLAECLFLWWFVSSFMGSLTFETPSSPGNSLLLLVGTGLALGLATAFVWPFGLMMYGYTMHSLAERGRAAARYYLMKGDD